MAKHVLRNARVEIGGTVLSDHVRSVTVTTSRPEADVTGMGATNTEIVLGIGDGSIEVEFLQDYQTGSVDQVLSPLAGSDTPFTVKVRATSAAISTTNPEWQMTALLPEYSPIAGSVKDENATTVTFRNAAQAGIVRATS